MSLEGPWPLAASGSTTATSCRGSKACEALTEPANKRKIYHNLDKYDYNSATPFPLGQLAMSVLPVSAVQYDI